MKKQHVLYIDWGSTNLRVWLSNRNGDILATTSSMQGVTRIARENILTIITSLVDGWSGYGLVYPLDIIMAGMIGSEKGLGSAPYQSCPVNIDGLVPRESIYRNEKFHIWIIPGVSIRHTDNMNVLRGEETQLIGAWKTTGGRLFVMPGTHSKWLEMSGDTINGFHTVMTGELYHLLMHESLIGKDLPPQINDPQRFSQGVLKGLRDDRIISSLFEIRAGYVLDALPREAAGEFLSGLLIGREIREMGGLYPLGPDEKITLIADQALGARYGTALALAGIPVRKVDGGDASYQGIRSFTHVVAD